MQLPELPGPIWMTSFIQPCLGIIGWYLHVLGMPSKDGRRRELPSGEATDSPLIPKTSYFLAYEASNHSSRLIPALFRILCKRSVLIWPPITGIGCPNLSFNAIQPSITLCSSFRHSYRVLPVAHTPCSSGTSP